MPLSLRLLWNGGLVVCLIAAAAVAPVEARDPADAEKRELPVTTDFMAVFADVLREHLRFDVSEAFFPNYRLPRASSGLFG